MTEENEENISQEADPEVQAEETEQPAPALELEETNKLLQDHIALLQAQQATKEEPLPDPQDDDDVLTVGQAKKAFLELQRANEELRVATKYKDYEEVISKFLPEAIKENPSIRRWIEQADAPYEQAYYLAKKSDAYLKERAIKTRSKDAEKVAKNNQSTGNLSSLGSNSSAAGTVDYKNMSAEAFREAVARNMGY